MKQLFIGTLTLVQIPYENRSSQVFEPKLDPLSLQVHVETVKGSMLLVASNAQFTHTSG